jgi:hypothetical protein
MDLRPQLLKWFNAARDRGRHHFATQIPFKTPFPAALRTNSRFG